MCNTSTALQLGPPQALFALTHEQGVIIDLKTTDIFLSIGLGFLAIYAAHSFLMVDACLDMGGFIDEVTGSCFDENYHEQYMAVSPVLLGIYFFIGLVTLLASIFTIKFIRGTKDL